MVVVEGSAPVDIPPTEMIYYTYEGNFELECEAEILSCSFIDEESSADATEQRQVQISLNRSVMHAQGGGQPTDIGMIQILGGDGPAITVTKVLMDRATGVASHIGKLDKNSEPPDLSSWIGKQVKVSVDADNRRILSECHTAGHLVDKAMADCETMMLPTKAYHFLEGPYVEYKGKIAAEDRDAILEKLQKCFQDLIEADIATEIDNIPRPEAEEICNQSTGVEDYFKLKQTFKEDEDVRIVRVAGSPVPCAGTHVRTTGDLKARKWGITGFRCKKGVVRVKYTKDVN